ncbi:MAG: hypothetical protein KGJ76_15130, partial [Betaproteobacteria bacterium]|nr:hypothetical protein [Betaproteobacteria bacterium]
GLAARGGGESVAEARRRNRCLTRHGSLPTFFHSITFGLTYGPTNLWNDLVGGGNGCRHLTHMDDDNRLPRVRTQANSGVV